ncbi:DUF1152 domain-containing protein [Yinghuangia seranimata]|uniref:DUF1152 domain-containing protein n=1 Tax=Yinghuangia seranimata TaxID=408067 RepID=UPI00248C516C|nr:DUF1152 domain-containing protein [Yinghuangia seranimata]MDI2131560.1 DUF1152 domain-containing protein [Yinghuangia seranimata]
MFSLSEPPLFTRLSSCERVLVAGAGGGFDVYAGLPLALALEAAGKQVHLANLSFVGVDRLPARDMLRPGVAAVLPETGGPGVYFPERSLARWRDANGAASPVVYAFQMTGVRPLASMYRTLCTLLELDAIVLVDGGTDILMRGDESGLGTPGEDMTSLAAVASLPPDMAPTRLVVSLGFGIDAYHGVCHTHVLENLAALERDGGYLGALSIPRDSREGTLYLDAVAHAERETEAHPSIVHGSVAAAIRGEFGNVALSERTRNSELFVNPLMGVYFTVELDALARRNLYLDRLRDTYTLWDVVARIEGFRDEVPTIRPQKAYPH